jgi:predicted TIM-barrel fold metal-dependent hydrolase
MPKYYAEKILEKHGVDRMLFGTDTPWHTPQMESRLLDHLGLSEDERDNINYQNAQRLLREE